MFELNLKQFNINMNQLGFAPPPPSLCPEEQPNTSPAASSVQHTCAERFSLCPSPFRALACLFCPPRLTHKAFVLLLGSLTPFSLGCSALRRDFTNPAWELQRQSSPGDLGQQQPCPVHDSPVHTDPRDCACREPGQPSRGCN